MIRAEPKQIQLASIWQQNHFETANQFNTGIKFMMKRLNGKIILLLFAFIIIQCSTCVIAESQCIRCEDFHREKIIECSNQIDDCGDCIQGFVEDDDDPRMCFALEILENPPKNLTVNATEVNIYLPCKFNAKVKCEWKKDGRAVDISKPDGYKWSNDADGVDTDDCSINIKMPSTAITGEWICSNKADSNMDSIVSTPTIIAIISKIKMQPRALYKVPNGGSVTVDCIFDQPVKCSWTRNGMPIKSDGNYEFIEGQLTTECSLSIRAFQQSSDQGKWVCSKPGDSYFEAVSSTAAQLIGYTDSANVEIPDLNPEIVTNDLEPRITFGNIDVSKSLIKYEPGLTSMLDLSCSVPSDAYRLFWFLHDETDHEGLREGPRLLYVDQRLESVIVELFDNGKNVELWCLVEYPNRDSHAAFVTIINYDSQWQQLLRSGKLNNILPVLITIIIILVVLLFVLLATCSYLLWRHRLHIVIPGQSKNKNTNESIEKLLSEPC